MGTASGVAASSSQAKEFDVGNERLWFPLSRAERVFCVLVLIVNGYRVFEEIQAASLHPIHWTPDKHTSGIPTSSLMR